MAWQEGLLSATMSSTEHTSGKRSAHSLLGSVPVYFAISSAAEQQLSTHLQGELCSLALCDDASHQVENDCGSCNDG